MIRPVLIIIGLIITILMIITWRINVPIIERDPDQLDGKFVKVPREFYESREGSGLPDLPPADALYPANAPFDPFEE